jgi:hypothetical protein
VALTKKIKSLELQRKTGLPPPFPSWAISILTLDIVCLTTVFSIKWKLLGAGCLLNAGPPAPECLHTAGTQYTTVKGMSHQLQ